MLTGSNFLGNCWKTLYYTLSGNITDPASRTGSRWIYSEFPDLQNENHPKFPIITIENLQPSSSIRTAGTASAPNTEVTTTITIYSNNGSQMDYLGERFWNSIYANRSVLTASGLKGLTLTPNGTDIIQMDRKNRIHTESFTLDAQVDVR